ncbi:MAG: hypothetical protein H6671_09355 [Anaerolineaceae bacterium]|nr:hypothetical protein [Anaerolineaceae bacterium]
MDTPNDPNHLRRVLEISHRSNNQSLVLTILVRIAEWLDDSGDKDSAAELVIFVLEYPLFGRTRARAEELYLQLEAEVCPRVLVDARTTANERTLDDMVAAVLAG